MRLICPNCSAQYEVDDSVIPAEGRDVQCSNCGQTWFQPAAAIAATPAEPEPVDTPVAETQPDEEYIEDTVEPEIPEPDTAEPAPEADESVVSFDQDTETFYEFNTDDDTADDLSAPDEAPEAPPAPEAEPEADAPILAEDTPPAPEPAVAEGADTAAPEDTAPDAPAETPDDGTDAAIAGLMAGAFGDVPVDAEETPQPPRRALDESVVNVLREEAEHEQRARAADENDTLFGGQREMGLQGAAAVTALVGADDASDDRDAGSRRDLLPDIEEINSTLRATSERHGQFNSDEEIAPDHDLEPQSSSFGRSFSLVILFAGLLVALYIFAPDIAAKLPAAKPALDMYTGGVDAGRVALDDLLRSLVDKMTAGQNAAAQ
ncbi:zinc-ribbon domain-containing protein [Actibacterium ureilyticum]|uniref:zinc-ribbon domain-containing protein n=1 Tax=Actibacterium ureilyticum TaxID=1590614 RepID=UPI001594EF3B|nr:zinc-ribbon domain-containing protein [Actibacterium ureilyticum]